MIKSTSPGIYELYVPETQWNYIGSSYDVNKRIKDHFKLLRNETHCNTILKNVYNKYKTLLWRLVESCEKADLLVREQFYIDTLNPTMNICKKAGSTIGYKHTPETLEKIKEFNRELATRESWINGVKKSWFQKGQKITFTPEQIQKRVESYTGYKHTENSKLKMSERAKNRDISKLDLTKFIKAGIESAKKPVAQYQDGVLIASFDSISSAISQFNTKQTRHLSDCLNGKRSTYKNFEWKYILNCEKTVKLCQTLKT
jgi:group I intron endonuclease